MVQRCTYVRPNYGCAAFVAQVNGLQGEHDFFYFLCIVPRVSTVTVHAMRNLWMRSGAVSDLCCAWRVGE